MIESLLKSCHSARIERDSFGNLIVIVGPDNKAPKWIFGAHMDHPGFVELPNSNCGDFSNSKYRDKYVFLGGVPDSYLETKFPIKEFDRFAMWDLPSFQISNDEIRSRAFDCLNHIDKERLIAAPDCGMGYLSREMAMQKLENLNKAVKSI